jgi:hypothetical protein
MHRISVCLASFLSLARHSIPASAWEKKGSLSHVGIHFGRAPFGTAHCLHGAFFQL